MSLQIIHRMNAYRIWANRRLLAVARTLEDKQLDQPFEQGRGSMRKTLQHLQATEQVWLARLKGKRNLQLSDINDIASLDDLAAAWNRSDARWQDFLQHLDPEDLNRCVNGNTANGQPFRMPVADCLVHLYTHAAYTQAQANNILRHLGAPVVDLAMAKMSRDEFPVV